MENEFVKEEKAKANKLGKISLFCGLSPLFMFISLFIMGELGIYFSNNTSIILSSIVYMIIIVLELVAIVIGIIAIVKDSKKTAPVIGIVLGFVSLLLIIFGLIIVGNISLDGMQGSQYGGW